MTQRRQGRPAKPQCDKFVPAIVKMDPKLRQLLKHLADEKSMTVSAYLRHLVEEKVRFANAA